MIFGAFGADSVVEAFADRVTIYRSLIAADFARGPAPRAAPRPPATAACSPCQIERRCGFADTGSSTSAARRRCRARSPGRHGPAVAPPPWGCRPEGHTPARDWSAPRPSWDRAPAPASHVSCAPRPVAILQREITEVIQREPGLRVELAAQTRRPAWRAAAGRATSRMVPSVL